MKSPTSLIRFRNAVGVMLALSAIFAVVLSTISLPNDKATAQVADADDAVAARAEAWFNSLTLDEAINAVLGAEADAVADVDGDADTQGRQYVDADETAAIDEPIEYIHDAWTTKSATQSFYDGLPADTTAANDSGAANQAGVNVLVDGSTANPGDIYAVGEQNVNGSNAIRGFQSVELWWNHLTCTEARIAIGEDNNDLVDDTDTGTIGDQPETSAVCDPVYAPDDATVVTSFAKKSYADVKSVVDPVGQAILGLSSAGTANSGDDARAMRWWNVLSAQERVYALYGDGVTVPSAPNDPGVGTQVVSVDRLGLAALPYSEIATGKMYTYNRDGDTANGNEISVALDDASKALVPEVKALINDRNILVYGTMGPYSGDYEGVVAWWSAIGCLEMQIAVGEDNEPGTEMMGFCNPFSALDAMQDRDGNPRGISDRERVTTVGRALLNLKSIPQIAAWWNVLSADQRVYVVYGNPPERSADWDHDGDETATPSVDQADQTPRIPFVTDADKAVFTPMYDGIDGSVPQTGHLTTEFVALLTRHGVSTTPVDVTDDDVDNPEQRYLAKDIVHALANEVFDPPTKSDRDPLAPTNAITDDNVFNPPYVSVGDWWGNLDCRVMRLVAGEDNDYRDPGVDDTDTATVDESRLPSEDDPSPYCGAYPGAVADMAMWIGRDAQANVDKVGIALLGLSDRGRPSFNAEATGIPTISGVAQVGAELTADTDAIRDVNDIPVDDDGDEKFNYQWLRDGEDIDGATQSKYTLGPDDNEKTISVRVWFYDGARQHEAVTSNATSTIAGSPGEISRIEAAIRSVIVSGGDDVTLSVDIYGLQDAKDNGIGALFTWSVDGVADPDLGSGREIDFTAPSQSGMYTVTASLDGGECQPVVEADRADDCNASINVQVRRPAPPVAEEVPPVNPPGDIPSLIPDSDGNQYEVFTPVEGGTFDGGEGYSINAASGAVPNGEFIGVRMSDGGAVSNLGMTHQRYTLGGNSYGVHAVDASGASVSSYVLDEAASVCVPLPAALGVRISDLALVAINSDGSLTILAAQVRLDTGTGITMVCGNLSTLPATVAVGAQGAPGIIPTPEPTPEPVLPVTGGTSPASSMALVAMLLGVGVAVSGTFVALGRRRKTVRIK